MVGLVLTGSNPLERIVEYVDPLGDFLGGDPFLPLWAVASALAPGTAVGVTPSISWTGTVQHVKKEYRLNDAGELLIKHYLVICRYCKRVAEYTWDETLTRTQTGTLPASPGVEVRGGQIIYTHPDEPTDTYDLPPEGGPPHYEGLSLDGTRYIWGPGETDYYTEGDLEGFYPGWTVTFVPNEDYYTIWQYDETPIYRWDRTAEYVAHASDGSSVDLRDTYDEGGAEEAITDYTDAISPSLSTLAAANTWGLFTSGQAGVHPGPYPEHGGYAVFQVREDHTNTECDRQTTHSYLIEQQARIVYPDSSIEEVTGGSIESIGVLLGTESPNPQPGCDTAVFWSEQRNDITYTNYVVSSATPGSGWTTVSADPLTVYDGLLVTYEPSPPPTEDYRTVSNPDNPVKAFNDAQDAEYEAAVLAWRQACMACAIQIIENIQTMMTEKKIAPATLEVDELRPPPLDLSSWSHTNLRRNIVLPAIWTRQIHFSLSGTPTVDPVTTEMTGIVQQSLLPTSLYSVTIGNPSPVVPAPPDTPWAVTLGPWVEIAYRSSTKAFVNPKYGKAHKNSYFSKGVTGAPEFGQTAQLANTGFFDVRPYDQFNPITEELVDTDLDNLMAALCVGALTLDELRYIAYWTYVRSSDAAKTYRETEHEHVNGSYSFTQPAITPP